MLYSQLLERDFEILPKVLRDFHSAPGGGTASGTADVRHESGWLAGLIGFPPSGSRIPLQLRVIATGNREVWIRRFGEVVVQSIQRRDGRAVWPNAACASSSFITAIGTTTANCPPIFRSDVGTSIRHLPPWSRIWRIAACWTKRW